MKNNKYKVIAICGKSGAGKDSLQTYFASNFPDKIHQIISCTTRPPRQGETEKSYHFLSIEEFTKEVLDNKMLEATCFNNWFYGTRYQDLDLDKINIGVFNLQGIENLKENPNIDCKVIYIDCPDKLRLLRALNREFCPNCEEICRRFFTDEQDFKDFANFDVRITNQEAPFEEFAKLESTIENFWPELGKFY